MGLWYFRAPPRSVSWSSVCVSVSWCFSVPSPVYLVVVVGSSMSVLVGVWRAHPVLDSTWSSFSVLRALLFSLASLVTSCWSPFPIGVWPGILRILSCCALSAPNSVVWLLRCYVAWLSGQRPPYSIWCVAWAMDLPGCSVCVLASPLGPFAGRSGLSSLAPLTPGAKGVLALLGPSISMGVPSLPFVSASWFLICHLPCFQPRSPFFSFSLPILPQGLTIWK